MAESSALTAAARVGAPAPSRPRATTEIDTPISKRIRLTRGERKERRRANSVFTKTQRRRRHREIVGPLQEDDAHWSKFCWLTKLGSAALRPHKSHPDHNTSAAVSAATRVRPQPTRPGRRAPPRRAHLSAPTVARRPCTNAATDQAHTAHDRRRHTRHVHCHECNDARATPSVRGEPHATDRHA